MPGKRGSRVNQPPLATILIGCGGYSETRTHKGSVLWGGVDFDDMGYDFNLIAQPAGAGQPFLVFFNESMI
jgi:hypothetical protein